MSAVLRSAHLPDTDAAVLRESILAIVKEARECTTEVVAETVGARLRKQGDPWKVFTRRAQFIRTVREILYRFHLAKKVAIARRQGTAVVWRLA